MKNRKAPTIMLLAALVLLPTGSYSGSNMEGTYTSSMGNVVLDLKSGGKAIFTLMG
jgi:hypothetical protein